MAIPQGSRYFWSKRAERDSDKVLDFFHRAVWLETPAMLGPRGNCRLPDLVKVWYLFESAARLASCLALSRSTRAWR